MCTWAASGPPRWIGSPGWQRRWESRPWPGAPARSGPDAAQVHIGQDADLEIADLERPGAGRGILHQAVAVGVRPARPVVGAREVGPETPHQGGIGGLAPVLAEGE